jgi:hypothetical protein
MPSPSPPRQLLPIAASLCSLPMCPRSHCPSTAVHYTLRPSYPVQLTLCAHLYEEATPFLVVQALGLLSAFGKLPPSCLTSVAATLSVSSHLTPPLSPCAGPRASTEPRAAPRPEGPAPSPQLTFGVVDHAGELRLFVVHPPRFDSAFGTVSGKCTEVHGCFPWTSFHGPCSRRPSLAVPRRTLRAVWTSMWSVHGLRFGPHRARRCPIVRVNIHKLCHDTRSECAQRQAVRRRGPCPMGRHQPVVGCTAQAGCGPHCPGGSRRSASHMF